MKKNSYVTVTDQFCGAGGSSQGVRNVANKIGGGLEVKLALNHWKLAIETHNTNFPDTDHDCTDISACDPRRYAATNILITSPECTNHSLAKGKKRKNNSMELFKGLDPEAERSRATMWDVCRFAEYHNYEIIVVENVVDARYWTLWDAWLKAMHLLGYLHECVYMNSMHAHPTPQSRDRMYIVFWKKGNKKPNLAITPKAYCNHCAKDVDSIQSWKNSAKQWGKYKQQYLFRCPSCTNVVEPYYYAAFNCIDWSNPGTKIGERKRPLSDNTIKRINYGIAKYWHEPQIITTRYTSGIGSRVKSALDDVVPTQPGDQSHALLNPLLVSTMYGQTARAQCKSSTDPFRVQTSGNGLAILNPILMNTEYDIKKKKTLNALSESLNTQTTQQASSVVLPFIVDKILDPIGTLKTVTKQGILSPEAIRSFLTYYYSGSNMASDITEATRTFSTKERAGIIVAGSIPKIEDCYYRMLLPTEIKLGMAFDKDYIVLGSGKDQVKQLGNAVTPPVMELLIGRCIETLN